jgi:hypothetical protein
MLEWTTNNEQNTKEISSIQDALVGLKNISSDNQVIRNNENLSFISTNQTGTILTSSIHWTYSQEYWITSTGWATYVSLSITSWEPILYHMAAFNSGSESSSSMISSWIIWLTQNINLSSLYNQHILVIEALGWDTQYAIDKQATTTIPSVNTYTLERDINGYKTNNGIYTLVNFVPRSRSLSWFNYQKMGMYLKE